MVLSQVLILMYLGTAIFISPADTINNTCLTDRDLGVAP
jgi:hypothetical protein